MAKQTHLWALCGVTLAGAAIAVAPTVVAAEHSDLGGAPGSRVCAELITTSVDARTGDVTYETRLPSGLTERQVDPAVNLSAFVSSNGQISSALTPDRLLSMGLPPEPDDPTQRADWIQVIKGVRHRGEPKISCQLGGVSAFSTYNWSGYRARAASGKTYYGAASSTTLPAYYPSTCQQDSFTQWVGVSSSTGNLVQAGYVVSDWNGYTNYPFYEFVNGTWDTGGTVSTGYPTIAAGQRGYYYVRYVSAQAWAVTISNLDSGVTFSANVTRSAGGTQYLGPQGDFITERLLVNSQFTQYMHHGDGRFRSAIIYFSGSTTARLSIQQPENIDLVGRNAAQLGYADSLDLSASNFTEHWAGCGLVES